MKKEKISFDKELFDFELILKMKKHYSICLEVMFEFKLTANEWMICENIEHLSLHSNSGYTDKTRAELGIHHRLSEDRMRHIVSNLVKRGFLERNNRHHLKTGKKWIEVMTASK